MREGEQKQPAEERAARIQGERRTQPRYTTEELEAMRSEADDARLHTARDDGDRWPA